MKPMRLSIAGLALAVLVAACGGSASSGSTTDPADADVTITSVDMVFDKETLTVPSGEAFTMALINDDSVPHNVAIYTDSSASNALFVGELITDATTVYDIPALEPGEYFFRCDLHPEMVGTLVVEG